MKLIYFVLCWLATLFTGMIVATGLAADPGFGFLFAGISFLCSIPFILLFCIFMNGVIKKNPTKKQLHATTFGFHFVLSLMTFAVFCVFEFSEMSLVLAGILSAYFAFDSLLFHLVIATKYNTENSLENAELLDSESFDI